jgi:nitrite reductase/ring-hydroxylating ferredoxin subunit
MTIYERSMDMEWHHIASTDEIQPGHPKLVRIAGKEIAVFYEQSAYYAVQNICPHKQAEICKGRVSGTLLATATGEYDMQHNSLVLRCPWHHWEFNLATGRAVIPSVRQRLIKFPVKAEDNGVYIYV